MSSAQTSFAVGHYEICGFLTRIEIDNQPGQSYELLILVCARSLFDQADEVVATGGNFGEPEMSGGVGSGCPEIGSQPFFCQEPGQCLVGAVGLSAWSCDVFRGGRGFCRGTGGCSNVVIEPIPCVGSDRDEMDRRTGLGNGFPGWRTKKRLSSQSASSLLLVGKEVFFVEDWRLWCYGRSDVARLGGLCLVGPQACQQKCDDCRT